MKKDLKNYLLPGVLFLCVIALVAWMQSRPKNNQKAGESPELPQELADLAARFDEANRDRSLPELDSAENGSTKIAFHENPRISDAMHLVANFQWPEAEEKLLESLQDEPDNQQVHELLVTVYGRGLKDYAKAVEYSEKLLTLNLDYPVALEHYREMCVLAGYQARALEFLKKVDGGGKSDVALMIGRLYADQKQTDKAIVALQDAAQRENQNKGRILEEIAVLQRGQKEVAKARSTYSEAIKAYDQHNATVPAVNPKAIQDDITAMLGFIELSIEMKDVEEAAPMLASLLQNDPMNPKLKTLQSQLEKISGQPLPIVREI